MSVKIASWNVNSLNVRLPQVEAWLASENPDIVALQETKLPDDRFPADQFKNIGYDVVFSGQKTFNGVALLVRSGISINNVVRDIPALEDSQRRILRADIGRLRILNLYVVNGQEVGSDKYSYKMEWLKQVLNFIKNDMIDHDYYVVLGDFNIAPNDEDVYDPDAWKDKILCSKPERAALEQLKSLGFADTFRLFDQPEGIFSWWDYRAAGFRRNLGLRIDLLLANDVMARHCIASWVDRIPRTWERPSDHAPVVSEFDFENLHQVGMDDK